MAIICSRRKMLLASASVIAGSAAPHFAAADAIFTPGDLVISTVSCSVASSMCNSTSGGLDTAAPIVLNEFSLSGGIPKVPVATLTLPSNISGEYGSASEGFLQLSARGFSHLVAAPFRASGRDGWRGSAPYRVAW